jgi:lambda repressor-like predicted transcriptional regulator
MISRILVNDSTALAKVTLKKRGWSYRAAAKKLGYSYTHIAHTLTGRRQSRRLLAKIMNLPQKTTQK